MISFKTNLQLSDPNTLHPHYCSGLRDKYLCLPLFEGLTRASPGGVIQNAAAESIHIDTTQTIYTFTIRSHQWSNGEPVTAYHFEKSWKHALLPSSICEESELFYVIKHAEEAKKGKTDIDSVGIQAVNDRTLVVELKKPTPYFLALLADPSFSPLYQIDEEPTVFNGPFILAEWSHNKHMLYKRNPYYWDHASVSLDEISVAMITNLDTAFSLYEKGELDLIGDPFSPIPLEYLEKLEQSDLLHIKEIARIYWLYCNTETFPLNQAAFRRALALAIDRKKLAEDLLLQMPIATLQPSFFSLLPDEEKEYVNITEAHDIFEQYGQEQFPLTLHYPNCGANKKTAEYLQQQWTKVLGLKVQLQCSDWNTFYSDLTKGAIQMGICFRSCWYNDPYFYLSVFKDRNHPLNNSQWENDAYKQLLEEADQHIESREYYLQRAERMIMQEMPVIPLCSQKYHYLLNDRFEGLYINDLGLVDFKWVRIKK
ncbi:MAG: peptide ABC transporter substrate-binding protein [Chlamydiales bacterium]